MQLIDIIGGIAAAYMVDIAALKRIYYIVDNTSGNEVNLSVSEYIALNHSIVLSVVNKPSYSLIYNLFIVVIKGASIFNLLYSYNSSLIDIVIINILKPNNAKILIYI